VRVRPTRSGLARTLYAGIDVRVLLLNVLPYPGALPVAWQLLGHADAPDREIFFREADVELDGMEVAHRIYVGGSFARAGRTRS
jgi:hypothetical protein